MRPASYSQEQIIEAGKVLVARGSSVTGFSLRKLLGGGNPARLLSIWEQHGDSAGLDAESVLPDDVADLIESARLKVEPLIQSVLVDAYSRLAIVARADVDDAVQAHAEAAKAWAAERDSFGSLIDELEMAAAAARDEAAEHRKDLEQARRDLSAQEARVMEQAATIAALMAAIPKAQEPASPKPAAKRPAKQTNKTNDQQTTQ